MDKWFVSSLSMHDFLLAATIVYLSIMKTKSANGSFSANYSLPDQEDMINALEKSHAIWIKTTGVLEGSRKSADILCIMLKKIRQGTDGGNYQSGSLGEHGHGLSDLTLKGMPSLLAPF